MAGAANTIKYKLDNEHDLVYLVVYQNLVQLAYMDKLLDNVQAQFRTRYKDALAAAKQAKNLGG